MSQGYPNWTWAEIAAGAQEDPVKWVPTGFFITIAGGVALASSPLHARAHRQSHGRGMTQKSCSKCLKAHSGHPWLSKRNLEGWFLFLALTLSWCGNSSQPTCLCSLSHTAFVQLLGAETWGLSTTAVIVWAELFGILLLNTSTTSA